ncbi:MAG: 1-acyl-sn-glycerol-3-phosphate acyltransferase [Flavobacteriales bacterium]|nr:1-acyl-sn-glycerol-3-phosphate acyltransferase [Flavobacteriales bacterium]
MKNVFGQWKPLKSLLITILGFLTWPRYVWTNKSVIAGMDVLQKLPNQNVLFVSNHQTYFADVILMYHAFSAAKWKFKRGIRNPLYLVFPKINVYYVAASETMKSGLLPKLFAYAGAISVQRTWRAAGKSVEREVNPQDPENISKAVRSGWLVTFPQGTTKAFEKGRKGTAHIIKQNKPIVVPVNIDGFRRAFDKKGLKIKKRDTRLLMKFYEPLDIDYDAPAEEILDKVMYAIRQTSEFLKVPQPEEEGEK